MPLGDNINDLVTFKDLEDAIADLDELRDNLSKIFREKVYESKEYDDLDLTETIKDAPNNISEEEKENIRDELGGLYSQYGIKYIADLILRIAKSYTPVDTGALRDSGRVELDESSNTAKVIFGEGLNYAVYVHEIMDNRHYSGRAKYLEDAAYQVINTSQVGNTPLFTFDISLDGDLVVCNINSIDEESFMFNLEERNALFEMSMDDMLEMLI